MRTPVRLFRSRQALAWLTATGLCLVAIWGFRAGFLRRPPPQPPRPLSLRYAFTLANTTSRPVLGVHFQAAAPVKQTVTQQCRRIRSSRPFRLVHDRLGNQVLQFAPLDFAPHAVKVITVNVSLRVSDHLPAAPAAHAPERYLSAGPYIQCDHPEIRRLARRLDARRPGETAAAIYRWVRGSVRYAGYHRGRRGALWTLQRREGDCTGQADLFVALCRACGIPARCVAGYICPRSAVLDPLGYHNWAEFFDRGSWRPADPQGGFFGSPRPAYIAMRILDPAGKGGGARAAGFDHFTVSSPAIAVRMNLPAGGRAGRTV